MYLFWSSPHYQYSFRQANTYYSMIKTLYLQKIAHEMSSTKFRIYACIIKHLWCLNNKFTFLYYISNRYKNFTCLNMSFFWYIHQLRLINRSVLYICDRFCQITQSSIIVCSSKPFCIYISNFDIIIYCSQIIVYPF